MAVPFLAAAAPAIAQSSGSTKAMVGQLAAAPFALSGAIAQVLAGKKQRQYNKAKLDSLMKREKAGNLGLSGVEKDLLSSQLNDPVRAAAAQQEQRAALAAASAGPGASGADLARLRTERGRTVADAAQQAALQIAQADILRTQQQRAEIEQRLGFQNAMRQQDIASIVGALTQGAGALGSVAGSAPGVGTGSTIFGRKFAGDERELLAKYARENPDDFQKMVLEELEGGGTPAPEGE